MMVYFRKRLNLELVGRIKAQVVKDSKTLEQTSAPCEDNKNDEGGDAAAVVPNQGQLIVGDCKLFCVSGLKYNQIKGRPP